MGVRQTAVIIASVLALLLSQWGNVTAQPLALADAQAGEDLSSPRVWVTLSSADETAFTLSTPAYTIETIEHPFGACVQVVVPSLEQVGAAGAPQLPGKNL